MNPSALENQDREELLQSSRRLLAEAQALSSRIAAVNEIATAINRKLDLNEILRVVGKQAKWLLDFEHCSVCIQHDSSWQVKVLFGPAKETPTPYEPKKDSPLYYALNTGQAQIVLKGSNIDFLQDYASQILIPLRSEDRTLGTINFAKFADHAYTEEDMRIGYLLALQLSLAIRNALILEQLKQAHAQVEQRNRELDAYNHTIAHDLKTPLQAILTFSELIMFTQGKVLDDKGKDYLRYVIEATGRMGQMIDQLLQLARLREEIVVNPVMNVNAVVDLALARLRSNLDSSPIQITVQPDLPPVLGQAQWIEEVFANLVGNAVKYIGKENPTPQIHVKGRVEGNLARYQVEDNGIGIEPSDQAKLFEMFSRVNPEFGADGLGLGLSIVRQIVTKLNGTVGVESVLGKGSTFWFTLPSA
jgi:signal transduction histidine kinase